MRDVGIATALVLHAGQAASGQVAPDTTRFESLDTLLPAGGVKLSDGRIIYDLSQWRSIAISLEEPPPGSPADTPPSFCTATLIGPKVLLTAGHCVWSSSRKAFKSVTVLFSGRPFRVNECDVPEEYTSRGDRQRDVAVCLLSATVSGVPPETLDDGSLYPGRSVAMMGYGCARKYLKKNKKVVERDPASARRLRYGTASIEISGVAENGQQPGVFARAMTAPGQPALCPGDSGGPLWTGASVADPVKGRRVGGLNVRDAQGPQATVDQPYWYSYFLPTAGDDVAGRAERFARARSLRLCSISAPDLGSGVDCRR